MLEEYDRLAITSDLVDKLSEAELEKRVNERDNLIKEMSEEEIKELLERPMPTQYKEKIVKLSNRK